MAKLDDILLPGDKIIKQAAISKKALCVTWFSIPGVFLIYYLVVYLPALISLYAKGEIKKAIKEAAGLGKTISISDLIVDEIFSFIPDEVFAIMRFCIGLLIFAWLCWALFQTYRHFQFALAYTETDLLGISKGESLRIPLQSVNNIYVETSLWGKLFGYGALTISSSKGSISVKNIAKPRDFAKQLAKITVENNGNFLHI